MIYYYLFKVRYIKGKSNIIVYYLVSFAEIVDFIHYLEKKHKNSFTIEAILNYHAYNRKDIIINKEWNK